MSDIEAIPSRYKRWALATSILASLIIGMAFSVVAFSTETPVITAFNCIAPQCQSGTTTCIVPINGFTCTTSTIVFATPYVNKPIIGHINMTLSPLNPSHSVAVNTPASSNIISFQTPGNQTILAFDSESATTINIPVTDTIIKSWAPNGAEPWSNVLIEGEGYLTTAATSTKQIISIKVEDCTVVSVFQTIQFETSALAISKIPFAIKGIVPNNNLGASFMCVSIDVSAPAADANTQITLVSLRVYGLETGFRTWQNMPVALTEIYGSSSDEQQFTSNAATVQMTFCVFIKSLSTSTTAYLSPFNAAGELSTSLRVNVGSGGTLGISCLSASVTIITTTGTWTVDGANGGGLGDLPSFGAISLTWAQTPAAGTALVPVGYHAQTISLTPTSFKIRMAFDATVSIANTVTFNWQSIGT